VVHFSTGLDTRLLGFDRKGVVVGLLLMALPSASGSPRLWGGCRSARGRAFYAGCDASVNSRIDEVNDRVGNARAGFSAAASSAQTANQRRAIGEAHAGFDWCVATVRREFETFRRGDRQGAVSSALGPDRALRRSYEASLAKAQALVTSAIDADKSSVAAASSRSITILLACLRAGLLIGAAVVVWVIRTILQPVNFVLALVAQPPNPQKHCLGVRIPLHED
jgi:hypothetical protein